MPVLADSMSPEMETAFEANGGGDAPAKARRRGDVVLRESGPWTPSVHALLRHFETVGFTGAPRALGIADDGRELLSYLPGESPAPQAWRDEACGPLGRLIRESHDAAASFGLPDDVVWQPPGSLDFPGPDLVIAHGDLGPWNIVAVDGIPTGLIDWEFAGPMDATWSLAEAVWLNAHLHDDDVAERVGLPGAAQRAGQARLILDGYGLPHERRVGFVEKMVDWAVLSARDEAIRAGVTPETSTAVDDRGYPFLWGITWRVRSAAWMLANRSLLERAIG